MFFQIRIIYFRSSLLGKATSFWSCKAWRGKHLWGVTNSSSEWTRGNFRMLAGLLCLNMSSFSNCSWSSMNLRRLPSVKQVRWLCLGSVLRVHENPPRWHSVAGPLLLRAFFHPSFCLFCSYGSCIRCCIGVCQFCGSVINVGCKLFISPPLLRHFSQVSNISISIRFFSVARKILTLILSLIRSSFTKFIDGLLDPPFLLDKLLLLIVCHLLHRQFMCILDSPFRFIDKLSLHCVPCNLFTTAPVTFSTLLN